MKLEAVHLVIFEKKMDTERRIIRIGVERVASLQSRVPTGEATPVSAMGHHYCEKIVRSDIVSATDEFSQDCPV